MVLTFCVDLVWTLAGLKTGADWAFKNVPFLIYHENNCRPKFTVSTKALVEITLSIQILTELTKIRCASTKMLVESAETDLWRNNQNGGLVDAMV